MREIRVVEGQQYGVILPKDRVDVTVPREHETETEVCVDIRYKAGAGRLARLPEDTRLRVDKRTHELDIKPGIPDHPFYDDDWLVNVTPKT